MDVVLGRVYRRVDDQADADGGCEMEHHVRTMDQRRDETVIGHGAWDPDKSLVSSEMADVVETSG